MDILESLIDTNRYQRVGPINEPNRNKAIRTGYRLFR